LSETTLKVGKKGEIFTNSDLRKKAKIKEGGKVRARVVGNKLIIEPIPTIEEILKHPVIRITTKEAEELSEESQKEEGIYG
jgi:bifunctional DNA-binding transcriptional regulator/antitoxin component of YhaV-PrlF toxin-antitoxin module